MRQMTENFALVQRIDLIKQMCKGRKVLHLGCTNYPYTDDSIRNNMLLHFDLEKVADDLWGIDFDAESIEMLLRNGSKQIVQADLEKLDELALNEKFDVIIAGEMIEHLNNQGLFLNGIKRFLKPDGRLVITTVNAYCGMRFLYYGLRGKKGRQEPVHPDHIAYYSYSTLSLLVKRHGMQVESFLYYDIGKEHRPLNRWFLNVINDVCVRVAPQWADGVIAVCKI